MNTSSPQDESLHYPETNNAPRPQARKALAIQPNQNSKTESVTIPRSDQPGETTQRFITFATGIAFFSFTAIVTGIISLILQSRYPSPMSIAWPALIFIFIVGSISVVVARYLNTPLPPKKALKIVGVFGLASAISIIFMLKLGELGFIGFYYLFLPIVLFIIITFSNTYVYSIRKNRGSTFAFFLFAPLVCALLFWLIIFFNGKPTDHAVANVNVQNWSFTNDAQSQNANSAIPKNTNTPSLVPLTKTNTDINPFESCYQKPSTLWMSCLSDRVLWAPEVLRQVEGETLTSEKIEARLQRCLSTPTTNSQDDGRFRANCVAYYASYSFSHGRPEVCNTLPYYVSGEELLRLEKFCFYYTCQDKNQQNSSCILYNSQHPTNTNQP